MENGQDDQNLSQTERAVLGLRGLIVHGQLKPGQRVLEQTLADSLGVLRTPARAAIQRICEEGFITLVPKRGYIVSSFTRQDVFDAIAIRGTLEGMAARLAAEKGPPARTLAAMHECLRAVDLALEEPDISVRQSEYARLNDRLHELICEAAQSPMMERALQRLAAIPPIALAQIKEVILHGADAALALERKAVQLLFATQDKQEGMSAFLEKRKPQYKGASAFRICLIGLNAAARCG